MLFTSHVQRLVLQLLLCSPERLLLTLHSDDQQRGSLQLWHGGFSANVGYVAKYAGDLGNSLRVSVCDSVNAYNSTLNIVGNANIAGTSNITFSTVGSVTACICRIRWRWYSDYANTQATAIKNGLQVGDNILVGNSTIGTQYVEIAALGNVTSTQRSLRSQPHSIGSIPSSHELVFKHDQSFMGVPQPS
jgi:hypothetical protein